nr:site-specific integrase [Vibrio cyclitrophicus]
MKIVENQASSPMSSECVQESISIDNEIRSRNQVTDQLINDAVGEVIFSNVSPLIHCIELFKSEPKWLNAQRSRALLKQTPDYCRLEIIDAIFPYDATPSHLAEKTLKKLKRYMGADKSGVLIFEEIRTNLTAFYCLLRDAQAFVESLDLDEAERCLADVQALRTMDRSEIQTFSVVSDMSKLETSTDNSEIGECVSAKLEVKSMSIPNKTVDINEILDSYRIEKENSNKYTKEVKDSITACENVHQLLEKYDMAQITREEVNNILPLVKIMPAYMRGQQNKKHFSGMKIKEIIKLNEHLKLPIRKEEQALKDIKRTSTIYNWAMEHNKISYNPFKGLSKNILQKNREIDEFGNTSNEKSEKKPFNTAELKRIFSHPVYTQGKIGKFNKIRLNYQYWVMIIALVTGARPNEICQLRVVDVRDIDGVLCFIVHEADIKQKLKNDNSVRYIPVPKKLFELGFMEYFDSVKSGKWLFPDLTYTEKSGFYGKVEDWFSNHFTKKMNLAGTNKSFSSLRHNFISHYQNASKCCPLVTRLVGHGNGTITEDRYGGRTPAKLLKDKIDEYDVNDILENVLPYKVEV